jgi:hypothetical protein
MSPEKKIKTMCEMKGFRVVEIKRFSTHFQLKCERNGASIRLCAPNMDRVKANSHQLFMAALKSADIRMKEGA